MHLNSVLACVHHDPDAGLLDQAERIVPALRRIFPAIVVRVTDATPDAALAPLVRAGAAITRAPSEGHLRLGHARREAVRLGMNAGAASILFCDFDRALHWAEYHPAELAALAERLTEHDFTVLERTQRAFNSHPRPQRDTESIVNQVFATVSGYAWDITAAARGLSRRAAAALLAGCPDETVGTDMSWPLFIQRDPSLTLGVIPTEGLEFETADRFADAIAAAGGYAAWMARIDANPREWALRLEIARLEVEASFAYAGN